MPVIIELNAAKKPAGKRKLSRVEAVRLVLAMAIEYAEDTVSSTALKMVKEADPDTLEPIKAGSEMQGEAVIVVTKLLTEVAALMNEPVKVEDLVKGVLEDHGVKISDTEDAMFKAMEFSTGHVSLETSKRLASDSIASLNVVDHMYGGEAYGWWIQVPEQGDDLSNIPGDLLEVLNIASQHNARWVLLDRDVAAREGLTVYDW
jgi:hypothetical protein